MPKMRVTELGRRRLYLTRQMLAGDVADIEPQCVEPAKALGYIEDIEPEASAPIQRGRPRAKVARPATDMTRKELLEIAEEKGVELPNRYVPKDELVELVEKADESDA